MDWLRQTVTVAQQVQWEKGAGVVVCPPKTRRSYRVVPVPLVVTDILAQHLVGRSRESDDYLFPASEDPRKAMYREQFSRRVWRPAIKASGLPSGTRLHDLRHTYASVLIAAGKGPKTVAARLGDTVAVTMAVYAHLFPNEEADTRAVVSSFVESALSVPSGPVPDAA